MQDIKNVNITIFTNNYKQQEFKDLLYNNYSIDKCIIGSLEKTKKEKEHYHAYISFSRKVNFNKFKKLFPEIHIEQVYGSIKQNYDYCCKEGEPFYCSFDINELLNKKDIESALIQDIFINELPIKLIIMKYPKYAIYNIKAIQELINIREIEKNKKNN